MNVISFNDKESCEKKGKKLPYIDSYHKMSQILSRKFKFTHDIIQSFIKIDHLIAISKLDIFNNLNEDSIHNTFNYLFFKIKIGIFVEIKNNKVLHFIPFINNDFKNEWSIQIKFPKGIFSKAVNQFLIFEASLVGRFICFDFASAFAL